MIQLRDCHLRTQQTLRRHTRNFVRACYFRPKKVSHMTVAKTMCHVRSKSARPSIVPSSETQWGLGTDSNRAGSSQLSRIGQTKRKRWEEAVNSIDFSHSNRKAWSTINEFTGRSERSSPLYPVSVNLSLRNSWRTGHTGLGTGSQPGSSSSSFSTYGRFQHLRVTAYLILLGK